MPKNLGPKLTSSPSKIKSELQQLETQKQAKLNDLELKMKHECSALHFQGLKTHILKFKCSIDKKISQIQTMMPKEQTDKDDDLDDSIVLQQIPQSGNDFEENLYQDKWETWLQNAEAKVPGESKELGDLSQNPEDLTLTTLSKRSQIVTESY